MKPIEKLIGLNIKLERTKRSLSQIEVANTLGVEASYLSRIESGTKGASLERVYEIIHVLGCRASDIFPESNEVETHFNRTEQ
jgi:transcriptional regulator with XRE-family HTH domain